MGDERESDRQDKQAHGDNLREGERERGVFDDEFYRLDVIAIMALPAMMLVDIFVYWKIPFIYNDGFFKWHHLMVIIN